MIIAIRERLFKNKNIITYVILGILALAFIAPNFVRQVSLYGDWMVRVNGQEVSYHDYARKAYFFEQQIALIRQHYGQYADMFMKSMGLGGDPKELALKALVDEELLNQAARTIDIHFDQEYINRMISSAQFVHQVMPDLIPAYAYDESGTINEERLSAYLKRTRLSASHFEYKLQEALRRVTLLRLIFAGVDVPEFELMEQFARMYQARNYAVITIPFHRILEQEKAKKISDQELNDFYQQAKNEYRIPEKRSGTVWTFSPDHYDITVSDADIDVYYDTHRTQEFIENPATVEVRRILFAVNEGSDESAIAEKAAQERSALIEDPTGFAAHARELSDDQATASKGGLMKPFSKGEHDKIFERTAFLLQADGDISDVIRTDKGFEILQRVSKKQVTFKPLASVRKEIINKLTKQKFAQVFAQDIQELQTQDEAAFHQFIAQHKGASVKKYDFKERSSDKTSQSLFSIAQIGNIAFFVEGDKGALVQLTGIQPQSLPDLASIKDDVLADVYEAKAQAQVKKIAQEAHAQALSTPLREVAQLVSGDYQETGFITPDKAEDKRGVVEKKLPIGALLRLDKPGLMVVHLTQRDGYLIQCKEAAPFDTEAFEAKKESLRKEMGTERMHTTASGFVASLYRDATIEMNKQQADE